MYFISKQMLFDPLIPIFSEPYKNFQMFPRKKEEDFGWWEGNLVELKDCPTFVAIS